MHIDTFEDYDDITQFPGRSDVTGTTGWSPAESSHLG